MSPRAGLATEQPPATSPPPPPAVGVPTLALGCVSIAATAATAAWMHGDKETRNITQDLTLS